MLPAGLVALEDGEAVNGDGEAVNGDGDGAAAGRPEGDVKPAISGDVDEPRIQSRSRLGAAWLAASAVAPLATNSRRMRVRLFDPRLAWIAGSWTVII